MAETIMLYGSGAMYESEWRKCEADPEYFKKEYPEEYREYQRYLLEQAMARARRERREAEKAAEEARRRKIINEVCKAKGVRDEDDLCYGDLPWHIF